MAMVVNGASTRKVARITEELCGTSFARSPVADLCTGLDPLVQAWNERELSGQRSPFVLVDALVLTVREDGRVRTLSALLAVGVHAAGYREILGLQLGDSESARTWMSFFTWLKGRGLRGVDRKSTRLNSSHMSISYAVFCLKKKKKTNHRKQ